MRMVTLDGRRHLTTPTQVTADRKGNTVMRVGIAKGDVTKLGGLAKGNEQ